MPDLPVPAGQPVPRLTAGEAVQNGLCFAAATLPVRARPIDAIRTFDADGNVAGEITFGDSAMVVVERYARSERIMTTDVFNARYEAVADAEPDMDGMRSYTATVVPEVVRAIRARHGAEVPAPAAPAVAADPEAAPDDDPEVGEGAHEEDALEDDEPARRMPMMIVRENDGTVAIMSDFGFADRYPLRVSAEGHVLCRAKAPIREQARQLTLLAEGEGVRAEAARAHLNQVQEDIRLAVAEGTLSEDVLHGAAFAAAHAGDAPVETPEETTDRLNEVRARQEEAADRWAEADPLEDGPVQPADVGRRIEAMILAGVPGQDAVEEDAPVNGAPEAREDGAAPAGAADPLNDFLERYGAEDAAGPGPEAPAGGGAQAPLGPEDVRQIASERAAGWMMMGAMPMDRDARMFFQRAFTDPFGVEIGDVQTTLGDRARDVLAWLEETGAEVAMEPMRFAEMPGYEPETRKFTVGGVDVLFVEDMRGAAIYAWHARPAPEAAPAEPGMEA